ncbi:hypothetical protein NDU88_002067 [Pleurodeles waltl]|uniref:Uncharacterized protein n=1 Tax=Pleurodeles waltl TaxID=8319 RepID=A0AAV7T274_PLEWA|nr:hypothetical protein NDU88_002067 [Pleurodeles waltl]
MCSWVGVCTQLPPRWAAPRGSQRPRSRIAGGSAAGGHKAPPPEREAGPPPVGLFIGCYCLQVVPVAFLLRPPPGGTIAGPTQRRTARVRRGLVHASRRSRLGAGDRPAWCARPSTTSRATGSHQTARVLRRSAPGPRSLLNGPAHLRRPPCPFPSAGPPGPARPGYRLVSAPPELNS